MALINQNFKIWAGDDKALVFKVRGVSDLISASAIWAVSLSPGSAKVIEKKSIIAGEITIDGTNVIVTLTPADTADLAPGGYYHELEITDGDGKISTVATGLMAVQPTLN